MDTETREVLRDVIFDLRKALVLGDLRKAVREAVTRLYELVRTQKATSQGGR